jgi:hypothetical protein
MRNAIFPLGTILDNPIERIGRGWLESFKEVVLTANVHFLI